MRIIVVVDLAKNKSNRVISDGLQLDFRKIRRKLPAGIEYLYCGGYNTSSSDIANLISLEYATKVRIDRRLQDIEKYGEKLHGIHSRKSLKLQNMIYQKETVSLCMFHLQEYIIYLKKLNRDNVLLVTNEFGCQLLLTYALGISIDSIHSFSVNPGSVILLDIHDMTSMNKIHF